VANLTAAHHAARSPALRLTRYLWNRGLEQPTAATRQVLRVVRSGTRRAAAQASARRREAGARLVLPPPQSRKSRRPAKVSSTARASAKRRGGPEWNSWSSSSLKYRVERRNLTSMCAVVRREWRLANLRTTGTSLTLESRDPAAEEERGRDLRSRYARRPVTLAPAAARSVAASRALLTPLMPDPRGLTRVPPGRDEARDARL